MSIKNRYCCINLRRFSRCRRFLSSPGNCILVSVCPLKKGTFPERRSKEVAGCLVKVLLLPGEFKVRLRSEADGCNRTPVVLVGTSQLVQVSG